MIEIKKGNKKFYVGDSEANPDAEITFVNVDENKIRIDHTNVSEKLKGQGVGNKLVKRVVDFAREENKKIIPLCPFAKAEFEKNKEYEDVLYK